MQILNLKDEPQHLPMLGAWHHSQWSYLNPQGSLEQRFEKMKLHLDAELIPSTFIAKDGMLLGSASIIAQDMDTKSELTPWLASVFVTPEHRNRGTGDELVKHVMQRAKEAKVETLYLFTPDREAFYQKLEWRLFSKENYRGHWVTVMHVKFND
ncbi:MAG: GNAT family N-acetyltransferase [Gammaproteobacteria bacterium]|nr:GNAT family N-acetyltransferase [Gammaproteobacteria bacterium]